MISREMNQRFVTVSLNLRGQDLTTFVKEAQSKIEEQINYDHTKFQIHWHGQLENQQRAFRRLAVSYSDNPDCDVPPSVLYFWKIPSGGIGYGDVTAGSFRWYAGPGSAWNDLKCIIGGGIYSPVRTFDSERSNYVITYKCIEEKRQGAEACCY